MNIDKTDRRTARTRRLIFRAISELMQEKKYSNITVQDIIDRADIGRSTFYAHFSTRDELLSQCIENIFDALNQHVANSFEHSDQKTRILPIAELFDHVKENKRLIRGLMSVENTEVLPIVQSYWNKQIALYLAQKTPAGRSPKVPPEILKNHISSAMIGLLRWWVENDNSYTPKQMDQYFQEMIHPGVRSVLGVGDC